MTVRLGALSAPATGGANPAVPYPTGPAAPVAGDRFVAFLSGSVATVFGALAGWTLLGTQDSGGSSPTVAAYGRNALATGTEAGTVAFPSPGGTTSGLMVAIPGTDPTTPFVVTSPGFGSNVAATDYAIPSQVVGANGGVEFTWVTSNAITGSWLPPTGYGELLDAANAANLMELASLDNAPAGATGVRHPTRSAGIRGAGLGIVVNFAPPAAGSPVTWFNSDGASWDDSEAVLL